MPVPAAQRRHLATCRHSTGVAYSCLVCSPSAGTQILLARCYYWGLEIAQWLKCLPYKPEFKSTEKCMVVPAPFLISVPEEEDRSCDISHSDKLWVWLRDPASTNTVKAQSRVFPAQTSGSPHAHAHRNMYTPPHTHIPSPCKHVYTYMHPTLMQKEDSIPTSIPPALPASVMSFWPS